MTASDIKTSRHSGQALKYVALRMLLLTLICFGIALALYFYAAHLNLASNSMVTLTALFGIPYLIGLVVAYFTEIWKTGSALMSSVFILFAVHILGAVFLQEGVVCIAMLAVVWYPCVFLGALSVKFMFNRFEDGRLYSASFLLLPVMMLIMDATFVPTVENRAVLRDIIIDAPNETVWDNLHEIPSITRDDGRWNITQDILKIPRPVAASTSPARQNDVRTNSWARGIRFEEHITLSAQAERLHWHFVFPDDSIKHKTDRHLDPDSDYFTIETGGFDLEALPHGRTRLTLRTQYKIATPVNWYGGLWGELLLGDIQNNVLSIIKTRSEGSLKTHAKGTKATGI